MIYDHDVVLKVEQWILLCWRMSDKHSSEVGTDFQFLRYWLSTFPQGSETNVHTCGSRTQLTGVSHNDKSIHVQAF